MTGDDVSVSLEIASARATRKVPTDLAMTFSEDLFAVRPRYDVY